MDSFEAGSRWPSPRQANRGASLDLVSRAVSADKPAYQYLGSQRGISACLTLCWHTYGPHRQLLHSCPCFHTQG